MQQHHWQFVVNLFLDLIKVVLHTYLPQSYLLVPRQYHQQRACYYYNNNEVLHSCSHRRRLGIIHHHHCLSSNISTTFHHPPLLFFFFFYDDHPLRIHTIRIHQTIMGRIQKEGSCRQKGQSRSSGSQGISITIDAIVPRGVGTG